MFLITKRRGDSDLGLRLLCVQPLRDAKFCFCGQIPFFFGSSLQNIKQKNLALGVRFPQRERWPQVCRVRSTLIYYYQRIVCFHNDKFNQIPCKLDFVFVQEILPNPLSFKVFSFLGVEYPSITGLSGW